MKRETVKTKIYNLKTGKYLIVKSFPNFISWGLVGGGVKKYESLETALLRETKEELGVDINVYSMQFLGTKEYRYGFYTNKVNTFSIVVEDLAPIKPSWEILKYKWI